MPAWLSNTIVLVQRVVLPIGGVTILAWSVFTHSITPLIGGICGVMMGFLPGSVAERILRSDPPPTPTATETPQPPSAQ